MKARKLRLCLTRSTALNPVVEDRDGSRRSASTPSKPWHLCRRVEGLTLLLIAFAVLWGCAAPTHVRIQPPPLPEGVTGARWGSSVEQVKRAIDTEGVQWFQDKTDQPPHVLYAFGTYLKAPAIFSYFFTSQSRRLFKVTVTFDDPAVYDTARKDLVARFGSSSFSYENVDHWSWDDHSLVILQKEASQVQISYQSGPFLVVNHEEQEGVKKK
jgi:hypothetical protein